MEEKKLTPEIEGTEQQEPVLEEDRKEEQPSQENAASAISENATQAEQPAAPSREPAPVVYRWDYSAQRQYDESLRRKKEEKKSGFAFFGIVSCAFLLIIGLLIGALAFRGIYTPQQQVDTVRIAEELMPSSVLVSATKGTTGGNTGSGFFVRQDGMIVTNYHVVQGMNTIKVKLYNTSEKKEATLIGYNAECDIAVLKIPGVGYPAVTFGDSSALRVGEVAISVGNPAGVDAEWSVTQGIISSVNRKVLSTGTTEITEYSMIQTDAAVNPGNSGGLLCNGDGEVIGIVARKQIYRVLLSENNDYVTIFDEGIGYVIPGNGAKQIIEGIINLKSVDPVEAGLLRKRPKIGISVASIKKGEKLTDEQQLEAPANGVLVASVTTGGANGLLEVGDIIVQFDGISVTEGDQVIEMLYSFKCGDKVKLQVYKNGEFFLTEIELTLGVFASE